MKVISPRERALRLVDMFKYDHGDEAKEVAINHSKDMLEYVKEQNDVFRISYHEQVIKELEKL